MKRPALAQDLVPFKELRANLSHWLKHIATTGRPVVVTNRGKAQAVLVQPEMLDELEEERDLVHAVLRGLHDLQEGHFFEDEDVWNDVDQLIQSKATS